MIKRQRGFSLIELLIVVAIILIIAAIAIPNLLKARLRANEASAANSLRSIATAQITYKIFHQQYAANLDDLGPNGDGLLTSALALPPYQQNGYQYTTTGTSGAFSASAVPLSNSQNLKNYCTDTPAAIYYETTSTCDPSSSPPIK